MFDMIGVVGVEVGHRMGRIGVGEGGGRYSLRASNIYNVKR